MRGGDKARGCKRAGGGKKKKWAEGDMGEGESDRNDRKREEG